MTVIQIVATKDRRGRHQVTFDDGTSMKLAESVIGDFGLYPGCPLDEGQIEAIEKANRLADARLRAVHILSAATVTERDLSRRLQQKGATQDEADETVRWLSGMGLLDDAQAARQIVARGIRRGYGERRIRQMLYDKQVPRAYWDAALADLPPMDDAIDAYLRAHLSGTPDEKQRRRAIDGLLRRGFSWPEINDGLRRYGSALADDPWEDQ